MALKDVRMGIAYKVLVSKSLRPSDVAKVQQIIDEAFQEIDATYNEWNPDSEISKVNRLEAGSRFALSAGLEKFLGHVGEAVAFSGGRFDPTVEPMLRLWKSKLDAGTTPTPGEIDALAPAVGWNNIHCHDGILVKDYDATSLTFGGIAKGLLVDMVVEKLNVAGFSDVYAEWGGEIRTSGHHLSGRPWRVAITTAGSVDSAVDTIALYDSAIATSGNYYQQWRVDPTETYTHIIDPRTCRPLTVGTDRISSVTVMAPSCCLADILATTAMMFDDLEQAQTWALETQENFPNTKFWFFTQRNR